MKKFYLFFILFIFILIIIQHKDTNFLFPKTFIYTKLDNGTYSVKINRTTKKDIVIPSEHFFKPVTVLDWYQSSDSIETITIPDSIHIINDLTFDLMSHLQEINVSPHNPYYSSQDGILYNKNKTTLIYYPEGKLDKTYRIPDSVSRIYYHAFNGEPNIEKIHLPDYLNFNGTLFDGLIYLKEISVNSSNRYLSTINGVLFNKDQTILYQYPQGKLEEFYQVPDGVEKIDDNSFYHTKLKHIKLGTVKEIDFWSFRSSQLEDLYIPSSVTKIEIAAFVGSSHLTSVTFEEPAQLTYLDNDIFGQCIEIRSVVFPSSITEIKTLPTIPNPTYQSLIPPKIEMENPRYHPDAIYVPQESLELYKQAPYWDRYQGIIQPIK